ncbi:fimbria/pilus outer membrane usher protein [Pantoea ananatis]|uniref:fimbria/pilus outer membrane usher protein n=1 Tax=Pantoea ananas TaxID=553 RepID=UPI00188F633E|nr:fimbria/pilus outer membrane usher protein [Pantoea ananatis]
MILGLNDLVSLEILTHKFYILIYTKQCIWANMINISFLWKHFLACSIGLTLFVFDLNAETFNSSLLVGDTANVNWNNDKLIISPGTYDVDIYVNNIWKGKFTIFISDDKDSTLKIKRKEVLSLDILGLEDYFDREEKSLIEIKKLLHGGSSKLDPSNLHLDLEVPQAYVTSHNKNWISPEKWDQGINGLFTSYNLNYYNFHGKEQGDSDYDNFYISLNSGLNFQGWHLRDNSSWMRNSKGVNNKWDNTTRYVERPLAQLGSVLRLGRSYTVSEYFDSFRFRGLTLAKSRQMMPDSESVYMPVITGIATTSSIVSVYQDGHIIHQLSVPPGQFAIRDLMPTGSRSDLSVEVKNSGGVIERFVVPFSSMSGMLRPGTTDYQINIGEVDMRDLKEHPEFLQASYSRGINNYLTGTAGAILNEDYFSFMLGGAISLPYLGSISTSFEQSQYKTSLNEREKGEKFTISWSKYFSTHTNLTLASYYYRSRDYASFTDFNQMNASSNYHYYKGISTLNSKQTLSANLTQELGSGLGHLSLSYYWREYWGDTKSNKQYNLMWSNVWNGVNFSLSYRRSELIRSYSDYQYDEQENYNSVLRSHNKTEKNLFLTVSFPMSIFESNGSISAHTNFQNNKYASSDLSLNASNDNLDYSVMVSHDPYDNSHAIDLYSNWKNTNVNVNSGLSSASDYRQFSIGASGSVLAWKEGIIPSANTGNNFVILKADGLENAIVNGDSSVRTNDKGVALVTSATPYRKNNFHLEQDVTHSSNVDIENDLLNIAPYEGSISYLSYKTDTRRVYTLDVQDANGGNMPFGAYVTGSNNENLGYVAQGSQIFIKVNELPNKIFINLSKNRKCEIRNPSEGGQNVCK